MVKFNVPLILVATLVSSASLPTLAQTSVIQASLSNPNSSVQGRLVLAAAERVYFRRNTTGADLNGTIQGSQHRDYVLGARAGQTMSTYTIGTSDFLVQVFAPNGSNLYTGTENWSGQLPSSGDYHLRISLPPGQETGESESYKFTVVVE